MASVRASIVAIGLLVPIAAPPLFAQMASGAMSADQRMGPAAGAMSSAHPMSKAEMKKMKACNAMSAGAARADKGCQAMMQAHPDMMQPQGGMTPHG